MTVTAAPQRTWTETARPLFTDPISEEHGPLSHQAVIDAMAGLDWLPVQPDGCTMPAMAGLALNAAIRELRLPKVGQVAVSWAFAPYELYGIECAYSNGRAQVYLLDRGSDLIPLCSDFWPKEDH